MDNMENTTKPHIQKRKYLPVVIISVIAIVVVLGIYFANNLLAAMVNEQLGTQMKTLKTVSISYEDIDVNIWRGSAFVKNLRYCSTPDNELGDSVPGYVVEAKLAQFQFVSYLSYIRNKDVKVGKVRVMDVSAKVNYSESAAKNGLQDTLNVKAPVLVAGTDTVAVEKIDTVSAPASLDISQSILDFVASINVRRVEIHNASLDFKDLNGPLRASCDSMYLNVRSLGYDFATKQISYNDSIYEFSVKNVYFVQPDGKYTLNVGSIFSKNTKGVIIKNVHHVCNVPKEKLAIVNGKIPVVWTDMKIKELKTSKINIVKTALDKNIVLDSVNINGGSVILYQDKTYPPVVVQRPFQAMLAKLDIPLDIRKVHVKLDRFHYTLKTDKTPPASLSMNNMDLMIRRISNHDPRDIVALAKCSLDGGGGYMTMNIRLLKDPICTWRMRIIAENANLAAYNPFLGSIAGAHVGGKLKRLECYSIGDSLNASGEFCMQYSDLEAKIIKGQSPIKALNDNSKAINGIVKILIPKSNPKKEGEKPKAYRVKGERKLMAPYFVYMMSPMFDGLKETLLAPFYLNKEIKEKKPAKETKAKEPKTIAKKTK